MLEVRSSEQQQEMLEVLANAIREHGRKVWEPILGKTLSGQGKSGQSEEAVAVLEAATTPTLPFPIPFLSAMSGFYGAGAEINGRRTEVFGMAPEGDDDRY